MPRPRKPPTGKAAVAHQLVHAPCCVDEQLRRRQQSKQEGGWKSQWVGFPSLLRGANESNPRDAWLRGLPTTPTHHIRGYFEGVWLNYRRGTEDDYLPFVPCDSGRTKKRRLLHAQPTKSNYPQFDIPAREDIFRFLKFECEELVVIGRKTIGILCRSERTARFSDDLRKWEEEHPHEIARILARNPECSPQEVFRRYARVALKGIGLRWPDKNYKRRAEWPNSLEAIGIATSRLTRFCG